MTAAVCLATIIGLGCLLVAQYKELESGRDEYRTLQQENARLRYDSDVVLAQDSIRWLILDGDIDPQLRVTDRRGARSTLSNVLSKSVLVIYFPQVNCYTCYKTIFSRIAEVIPADRYGQVILLTNYENLNLFRDFVILSRTVFDCYNINPRELASGNLFAKLIGVKPFMFIPGQDRGMTDVCFFNEPRPRILDQFFNRLTCQFL